MEIEATQAVRIKTVVTQDGVLILHGPFHAADNVEVIVLSIENRTTEETNPYPLRGTPYTFTDPFAGVAEDDWVALK